MELKVYEGYKPTSSKRKSTATSAVDGDSVTLAQEVTKTKTPSVKIAGKTGLDKPKIALFIDVDNAEISRENLLEILFYVNGKFQIELCKLYGFSDETLPGIREIATSYNVSTIGKMKFKQPGINCLDSRLLIDAYECALNNQQKVDMIFVWCYPCDLSELFEKILNLGVSTATIDNSVFDCKNKFVSQTFKLYSQYNFSFEQSMYGKVKNEPSKIAPSETVDNPKTLANVDNQVNNSVTPVNQVADKTTNEDSQQSKQPTMIDGVIPPVLPRRSIPERSNPNAPKKQEPETSDENNDQPSSLVEEIARKLNLAMPSDEEISNEMKQIEEKKEANSNLLMDMLRQAGFDDLLGEKKTLKYEDTIGDL